jgi:hypothetical protein
MYVCIVCHHIDVLTNLNLTILLVGFNVIVLNIKTSLVLKCLRGGLSVLVTFIGAELDVALQLSICYC